MTDNTQNNTTNNTTNTNNLNNKTDGVKNLFNLYFRGNYIFIIPILVSVLFKKTDYIYWIFNLLKEYNSCSFLILLNIVALYIIFYKIKFNFTFTISYN